MAQAVFELDDISRRFGGVQAVDGVSIGLHTGEIHGLIGPNGAGKTTVINLATGIYRPDKGRVRLGDRDVTGVPSHRRARLGLARTYQVARLFDEQTVQENVLAGLLSMTKSNKKAAEAQAEALLASIDLGHSADTLAADLPHGQRKLVEVARALWSDPVVVLLDEPAAGLAGPELEVLSEMLRERRGSTAVLLVEHNMDLVGDICDVVTVVDSGRQLLTGTPDDALNDPKVVEAYLGVA